MDNMNNMNSEINASSITAFWHTRKLLLNSVGHSHCWITGCSLVATSRKWKGWLDVFNHTVDVENVRTLLNINFSEDRRLIQDYKASHAVYENINWPREKVNSEKEIDIDCMQHTRRFPKYFGFLILLTFPILPSTSYVNICAIRRKILDFLSLNRHFHFLVCGRKVHKQEIFYCTILPVLETEASLTDGDKCKSMIIMWSDDESLHIMENIRKLWITVIPTFLKSATRYPQLVSLCCYSKPHDR